MKTKFVEEYLTDVANKFKKLKEQADGAVNQVTEEDFTKSFSENDNSIAVLFKHLAGNFMSRWTNFLTTDGEKPNRNRDTEFEVYETDTKKNILEKWEKGWNVLFDELNKLEEEDFGKTVFIRREPHSIIQAINRQLTHTSYHVGQIVLLAKTYAGVNWKTLSVAKGGSKKFNLKMEETYKNKNYQQ